MSLDMHPWSDGGVTGRKARVIVTGSCDGLAELRETLTGHPDLDVPGWCQDVHAAAGMLASGPSVVLHATRDSSVPETELAAIREHTQAPIILVSSGNGARLLEQALQADVADVLLLPQPAEKVAFAVNKARNDGRQPAEVKPAQDGRVLTVFAPKGGTGKSVLATNLAAALAGLKRKRTLLLDLHLQFGDAALMLGSEPDKTIYDLVVAPGELDSEKLIGYTVRHSSGLDILAAPLRPEDAELVTEAKVVRVLEVARESYEAIVVDTSPLFHGTLLATLDRTDALLLVCGLDVTTLKNVRVTLQTLELLSFPRERVSLVLNHAGARQVLKRSEVEAALGDRIRFEVPYEADLAPAVGRGEALALRGADGFSRAVREIASALAPQATGKRDGASATSRLRPGEASPGKRSRWSALLRA
jgi:pilus assembly protein CpaE